MFTSTVFTTTLLLTTTLSSVNAIPIWSRLPFARRDALTPDQLAQGSNFFFDSLRLEDTCTPGQVACISSNLASCSGEGNWEITPCTGNNTCLAVPSTDNGIVVQCMLFTTAQADIGSQQVSVDFNVTSPPFNTTASPAPANATETTTTSSDSADPTDTATSTDTATPTDSASDPAPTDDPSTNSTATATATDSVDPSATCSDDAPEVTETELITVIISPDPTLSGEFDTTTLFPTPDVTGTAVETSIPFPNATATDDPTPTPTGTCTEDPEASETDTATEDDPEPTGTDGTTDPNSTDSSSSPDPTDTPTTTTTDTPAAETGLTLSIPPNFSVPGSTPTPSGDVSIVGTHFVSADPSPTPGRMARMVRRKVRVN